MVRWGAQVRPPDPARRFDGTDAALARLDALLALAAATGRQGRCAGACGSTAWWHCAIACA